MSAHSPAPWNATHWPGGYRRKPSWIVRRHLPATRIARVDTETDAALIAAAPELLEACKLFTDAAHAARDALNDLGEACPASIAFAAEKARAAIAKAGQT